MYTIVYLVSVLAAYSNASPAQLQARGFASVVHQEQQQQSSAQSSFNAGGFGNGLGGFGGGFSGSSQFSQQSSSFSSSSVMNNFAGIGSQIGQIQGLIASGAMTQQVATQQMVQLASAFQTVLPQVPMCGSCLGQNDFWPAVGGVFQQFTQLMTYMQSSFGGSFSQICAPIGGLQSSFNSLFQSASSSGVSLNSFVPPNFPSVFGPLLPGLAHSLNSLGFK